MQLEIRRRAVGRCQIRAAFLHYPTDPDCQASTRVSMRRARVRALRVLDCCFGEGCPARRLATADCNLCLVLRQVVRAKGELDVACFTGAKMYALESAQRPNGIASASTAVHVELEYLVAVS